MEQELANWIARLQECNPYRPSTLFPLEREGLLLLLTEIQKQQSAGYL